MFRYLILICLLICLCSCNSQPCNNQINVDSIEKQLDVVVNKYIEDSRIAGLIIGIARDDTILLLREYGYSDMESGILIHHSMPFEIGSITKQFTAVAIMQLVEKNLISLDDNIDKYLNFNTNGHYVTIENLLNHTSGIKNCTELPFFRSITNQFYNLDSLLRYVEKESFDFEPGQAMKYSNTGYLMLGMIIEKVTGQAYLKYISDNILNKAGLFTTDYCNKDTLIDKNIYGYKVAQSEELIRTSFQDPFISFSGGALCSTVEDLLRWNYILHNTNYILDKNTYNIFIKPSKLNDSTELRYANGLFTYNDNGVRVIGHGGRSYGFFVDSRYFPDYNIAIVTMMNTTGGLRPESVSQIVSKNIFIDSYNKNNSKYLGNIDELPGVYYFNVGERDIECIIDKNNSNLTVSLNGESNLLIYDSNTEWRVNNSLYSFKKDDKGILKLHMDDIYNHYIFIKQ